MWVGNRVRTQPSQSDAVAPANRHNRGPAQLTISPPFGTPRAGRKTGSDGPAVPGHVRLTSGKLWTVTQTPGRGSMTSIRTPDQRLRVFVSSTMKELADERAAARRAIERLHRRPVLFELGARPYPPQDLYLAYLRQSDVFIGIYGQQYGWIAPGRERSGLEDEYLAASDKPQKAPPTSNHPLRAAILAWRTCSSGLGRADSRTAPTAALRI